MDRKEIQDVIAYMRAVANTRDNVAIERIINFPARGIGDSTVEKLGLYSREAQISTFNILLTLNDHASLLPKGIAKKVEAFADLLKDLYEHKSLPVDKFMNYVIERVGFEEAYRATKKEEDITRLENVQQLQNYAKEFVQKMPEATLQDFLETVTLEESGKDDTPLDHDKVTIATMHSVKGLEFRCVFIVGCEEEIFPSAQALKNGELEEERRIMYVAITRAKERLYISCAQRRFRFGRIVDCLPSRFLAEAKGEPQEDSYKVYAERKAYLDGLGNRPSYLDDEPSSRKINNGVSTRPKITTPQPKIVNPTPKDLTGFIGGAKVKHPTYGEGTILIVLGSGANATATVEFKGLGVKKFIIALAPLVLVK